MHRNAEIAEFAQSLVGIDYRFRGRDRFGIDCVGLLILVAERFGVPYRDSRKYPPHPPAGLLTKVLMNNMVLVPLECVVPGNVVSFWLRRPDAVVHAGILVAENRIVHVLSRDSIGKVVEHGLDDRWLGRRADAYAFPEVK